LAIKEAIKVLWFVIAWLVWWLVSFIKPKWIAFRIPAVAMTIAPFVFYNPKQYEYYVKTHGGIKAKVRLHNHEIRHVWQQRVFSPLVMLLLYLFFFIVQFIYFKFIKLMSWYDAYRYAYWYNPFEIDARRHE
jgi:hypothetical protein